LQAYCNLHNAMLRQSSTYMGVCARTLTLPLLFDSAEPAIHMCKLGTSARENGTHVRTFSGWHSFAKEQIWSERMTRIVVGRFCQISTVRFRWTNYLVSSTWSQWRERHFVRKRRRMLSKRSVVLLCLRILVGFWDSWQSLRLQQRAQTRRLTQVSIRCAK
jgi:hypothetical protein